MRANLCYTVNMRKNMLETVVHVRFSHEQMTRLDVICRETGLSRSQVVRHLLDNASIRPAIIRTEAPAHNGTLRGG